MNPVLGICGRQRQGKQGLVIGSLALQALPRESQGSMSAISSCLLEPQCHAHQPCWLSTLLPPSLLSVQHYPSI